jgi:flagellum-specific peptidoglycan hydrolase FlgJ
MATAIQREEFFNRMWNEIKGEDLGGRFPSVILGHSALETGYGTSELNKIYHNYFGIKADSSWKGRSVNLKTREVFSGQSVTINSNFRVYDSLIESFRDYMKFVSTPRYKAVWTATTPLEEATALGNAGYATGPNFSSAIMQRIKDNDLLKFDDLKKKS